MFGHHRLDHKDGNNKWKIPKIIHTHKFQTVCHSAQDVNHLSFQLISLINLFSLYIAQPPGFCYHNTSELSQGRSFKGEGQGRLDRNRHIHQHDSLWQALPKEALDLR